MKIETDSAGNQYIDVENARITYVRASDRTPGNEWAGSNVIRIQAYRVLTGSRALHKGAEIMLPANRPSAIFALVEALCQLARVTSTAVPGEPMPD